MSDGLKLPMFSEVEQAVDTGTHRDASRIIMRCSEMTERLAFDLFYCSSIRIVLLFNLFEIPVHSVLYARSHIDVLECREGCADRDRVLYTIAPILEDVLLENLTFLGRDAIAERTGIGKIDLIVTLLHPHRLLALEGVYTAYRPVERGQGEREGRVAHVLRYVE